jgi:hypothetical protein
VLSAAAEALKREAFKFAASAAPYDNSQTAPTLLDQEREKIETDIDDLDERVKRRDYPVFYNHRNWSLPRRLETIERHAMNVHTERQKLYLRERLQERSAEVAGDRWGWHPRRLGAAISCPDRVPSSRRTL